MLVKVGASISSILQTAQRYAGELLRLSMYGVLSADSQSMLQEFLRDNKLAS